MKPALSLARIRKRFDTFLALDDASFELRYGEMHALLGENGAGKSTLMNVAAGLYRPDSGSVMVDDVPVTLAGPAAAHRLGRRTSPSTPGWRRLPHAQPRRP